MFAPKGPSTNIVGTSLLFGLQRCILYYHLDPLRLLRPESTYIGSTLRPRYVLDASTLREGFEFQVYRHFRAQR